MKKRSRLIGMTALVITASLLMAMPAASSAAECHIDQQQLRNTASIIFGGNVVLGQTFVPGVPGQRVCRVKVIMQKNFVVDANGRPAGPVTLRLLRSNLTPLDAAVTIPAADIPLGQSVQVFEFGCNGAPLIGMPFYGLRLEALNSPHGAYAWRGSAGDPYVRPGSGDKGWRNAQGGVQGQWASLGGWDYAFQIYVCN